MGELFLLIRLVANTNPDKQTSKYIDRPLVVVMTNLKLHTDKKHNINRNNSSEHNHTSVILLVV